MREQPFHYGEEEPGMEEVSKESSPAQPSTHSGSPESRTTASPRQPGVVQLEVTAGHFKNFTYLVYDPLTLQAVVIDPAWDMARIQSALNTHALELSGVLLTHGHKDHTNLADAVSREYDCPVLMSEDEVEVCSFRTSRLVPIDETPWLIGNLEIVPMKTPGHTPGSMCFKVENNLFSGDVLFAEGCGLCTDAAAAYAMYDSLQRLKKGLLPATRIYPGHCYGKKPGFRFSEILKFNIYLHFTTRESFAAFRLRARQNPAAYLKFK